MTKISIIIPVYNVENYLEECLNSVIKQTLKDIEIICVNDGSTDNSLNILNEYQKKDSRIKIVSQENQGLSAVRNYGIKFAKSEYVSFVDSDDCISLDFCEKLYNAAKKYDADIAYATLVTNKDGVIKNCYEVDSEICVFKVEDKYRLSKLPYNCHVPNKIYRVDKLRSNNLFFEENITYEDMEWTHKTLYYLDKFVTVPEVKYNYRINQNSITNTLKYQPEYQRARYKSLDFIQRHNIKIKRLKDYVKTQQETYCLFNIPILRIDTYINYKQYYLFNKILFFEVKTNKLYQSKKMDVDINVCEDEYDS